MYLWTCAHDRCHMYMWTVTGIHYLCIVFLMQSYIHCRLSSVKCSLIHAKQFVFKLNKSVCMFTLWLHAWTCLLTAQPVCWLDALFSPPSALTQLLILIFMNEWLKPHAALAQVVRMQYATHLSAYLSLHYKLYCFITNPAGMPTCACTGIQIGV